MDGRRRGVSRRQVAEAAGVSLATVSQVLNGRGDQTRVSRATQARVREVAQRLRYIPNSAARAIVEQRYLTLGIIARRPPTTLHLPIFQDFMVAAIDEAARYGHNVKFLPPVAEPDSYDVATALRDAHVDGVLVENLGSVARALSDWSVPVVYIGLGEEADHVPPRRIPAVIIDECAGLRAAARHLISRGCTKAAILAGPSQDAEPLPRLDAFAEEFRRDRTHVKVYWYNVDEWSPAGGYRGMRALLDDRVKVDAVHVGNDLMAIGVIKAAHQAGVRIPEDLELVGFGDFGSSEYLDPPLTTVHWPLDELGRRAANKLITQLQGRRGGQEHTRLPADLIIRESSPPGSLTHATRRDA